MNFNEKFNVEDLKTQLEGMKKKDTRAKKKEFKEVPFGTYEVAVKKLELRESSNGNPMVSIWFKIVAGDYKKQLIFYNQIITQAFQIKLVCDLLESFDTGLDIDFIDFLQFEDLLTDIFAEVIEGAEYALEYSEGKNGFANYKITDKFLTFK